MQRIPDLVLDSGALIRVDAMRLGNMAERIWTVPQVLDEVRDERARLALAALPFTITTRAPTAESLRAVAAFAKQTGDFPALSRTDLMVLALVHTLHLERNPERALRTTPDEHASVRAPEPAAAPPKTWGAVLSGDASMPPPASPWKSLASGSVDNNDDDDQASGLDSSAWPDLPPGAPKPELHPHSSLRKLAEALPAGAASAKDTEQPPTKPAAFVPAPLPPRSSRILSTAVAQPTAGIADDDDDDNAGAWAAPGKPLDSQSGWVAASSSAAAERATDKPVSVACATGDFAMQNVLLQMRLRVVSVDGLRVVNNVTHWVLKCDSCFTITPADSTRLFCPACGKATLARLAYSIDAKGVRHYHYAKHRNVKTRGARYAVAKDANLLLSEDQMLMGIWAQRANAKKDAGSMFGMDVNESMGLPTRQAVPLVVGYGSANPNEAKGRERRGKAKPKSKFAAPKGGQRSLFAG